MSRINNKKLIKQKSWLDQLKEMIHIQQLSMEERKIAYWMFAEDYNSRDINEFLDIGTCIKNQIQDNKLIIHGFDNEFNIKCEVI